MVYKMTSEATVLPTHLHQKPSLLQKTSCTNRYAHLWNGQPRVCGAAAMQRRELAFIHTGWNLEGSLYVQLLHRDLQWKGNGSQSWWRMPCNPSLQRLKVGGSKVPGELCLSTDSVSKLKQNNMLNKGAEVSVAQLEVRLLGLCKTFGVNLQQYCIVCIRVHWSDSKTWSL